MSTLTNQTKPTILCLCRAPLSYAAGIPKTAMDLYSDQYFDVIFASIDLTRTGCIEKMFDQEYIYKSDLGFRTFGFSLRYVYDVIFRFTDCSIVHYQHPDPISAIAILLRFLFRSKFKLIITWHADIYKSYYFLSPILIILDLLIFLLSKRIIFFTSSHLNSSLISFIPTLVRKSLIIPQGVEMPTRLSFKPNKYKSNPRSVKMLSVGRLVPYKGYNFSIRAIGLLKDMLPELDINYAIIGNGPLYNDLRHLVRSLDLQSYVFLLKSVEEEVKFDLYREADYFLFPSISQNEAYGIAQLEAMHYALPIVNTSLGNGVNQLAPHNVCSITVKPGDAEAISRSLYDLITNPQVSNRLSSGSLSIAKSLTISNTRNHFKQLVSTLY